MQRTLFLYLASLLAVVQPLALPTRALPRSLLQSAASAAACGVRCSASEGGGLSVARSQQDGPGQLRDLQGLWGKLVAGPDKEAEARGGALEIASGQPTDDLEYVPLVLVVGASGRTGRIIVRKLVMRGFRVAVLVRSLASDTLNLLGSGVSYRHIQPTPPFSNAHLHQFLSPPPLPPRTSRSAPLHRTPPSYPRPSIPPNSNPRARHGAAMAT